MLNNLKSPNVCRETEHYVWTIDTFNETLLPLTPLVTNDPLDM